MTPRRAFEIFLTAPPGLELVLKDEAQAAGFAKPKATPGGVRFRGHWPDVWRANLALRGAGRVLARVARFQAMHLDQLEARTREIGWTDLLRPDVPITVEATTRKSKIYHQGAAAERVARAIHEITGAPLEGDNPVRVQLRIEDNQCLLSLDTSGEPLHRRGQKPFVGKAPMRETLAALFLRQCGYTGTEPVLDPMCGSGTFLLEAAEIALGRAPGRDRPFAFERFANFDADAWKELAADQPDIETALHFHGSDRDAGAVAGARSNAATAGLGDLITISHHAVSDLERPEGPPGLVMVNPPYGTRIGERKQLFGLYGALGKTFAERFADWRVGLVTTDASLANATALPFTDPGPPVAHGGLRITLWQTGPLP
ncbi:THUMP domain-containing class I SAM-dependent RNA methyltransferase [Roseovarius sp. B08]|uniref:THUMP domain-containing class I SAM-dependent RNA methyltransferase n=1 Tax=Roseovarius sp. B08 TaxID=3449223 RepID=UPI003EDBE8CF